MNRALARTKSWDMGSQMLWRDFMRMMEAKDTSEVTRETYTHAAACLLQMTCTPLEQVTTADLESWLIGMRRDGKAATTVSTYCRHVKRFYRWAHRRGLIEHNPADAIDVPAEPDVLVPVVTDDAFAALLATCKGKTYRDRRDAAILRTLRSCGLRAGELAGLTLADVDLLTDRLVVRQGKWAQDRLVGITNRAGMALSAALRARPPAAGTSPEAPFFCAIRAPYAPLTSSGVLQIVRDRCERAGLPPVHPHQLRHSAAAEAKDKGMTEADMMAAFGWRKREMVSRYGRAVVAESAARKTQELRIGDVA